MQHISPLTMALLQRQLMLPIMRNVDLDKDGKIIGIEFLTLDVPNDLVDSLILFDELKDESELLNKLIETSRAAAGH